MNMVEVENPWLSRPGCCQGLDWEELEEEWEDMMGVGRLEGGFLY